MTETEEFAEFVEFVSEAFALPATGGDVAIAGRRGNTIEGMLDAAIAYGSSILQSIARAAVSRLLDQADPIATPDSFFTEAERQQLTEALAAVNGTADQLARAMLRDYLRIMQERHGTTRREGRIESVLREEVGRPLKPLAPEAAIDYFRELVPTLGTDPEIFGPLMRRHAFTLAVATETELLRNVQVVIAQALETGEGIKRTPTVINQLLTDAGVTPRNPQYAEMVFRTNAMDAYNQASDEERTDPDVIDEFPVWQYSGIEDGRERDEHRAHFDKYFPARASFRAVRDSIKVSPWNCRCTSIPVYRDDWKSLQEQGARIEAGW